MNQSMKWAILVVVLVLLAVGVAFAIVKATGVDKTRTVGSSSLDWQLGRLDEDGDVIEDPAYMMTKKHLNIDGLTIEVVKKPGVEVFVALFDKKGNPLNVTFGEDDIECYEITTSETAKTVWSCEDYLAEHTDVAAGKPAYAVVFLNPVKDVDVTSANMRDFAKQVTITCAR